MTKQEKIQESYVAAGVDWEAVKDYVDDDGWIMSSRIMKEKNKLYRELADKIQNTTTEFKNNSFDYRPKSLRGIEDNAGWKKIESEKDLPKPEIGLCWVYLKDGTIDYADSQLLTGKEVRNYWIATVTHYQPIHKPNLPLY